MAEVFTIKSLATGDQKAVAGLKRAVGNIADKLSVVRESARDVAPRIMKLFATLNAKHEDLGGFVGFARLFDASIPTHAADKNGIDGYRKHKTYVALDYMRRLQTLQSRPRGQQGVREPATDQLARTIRTILQVFKDDAPIWAAVAREFGLRDRAIARLKARVQAVRPLVDLSSVLKPVAVPQSAIVHMERSTSDTAPQSGRLEGLDVPGRRIVARRRAA